MKECQKWWAKASANYISYVAVKEDGRLVEAVWRAALEEVLKQCNKTYAEDTLPAVENWIKSELGES